MLSRAAPATATSEILGTDAANLTQVFVYRLSAKREGRSDAKNLDQTLTGVGSGGPLTLYLSIDDDEKKAKTTVNAAATARVALSPKNPEVKNEF